MLIFEIEMVFFAVVYMYLSKFAVPSTRAVRYYRLELKAPRYKYRK